MSTYPQPSWWGKYAVHIAIHAAIFLTGGPLVGAAALFAFGYLGAIARVEAAGLLLPFMLVPHGGTFGLMLIFGGSYAFGWPVVLLTGIVAGVLHPFVDRTRNSYILVGTLGALVSLAWFVLGALASEADRFYGPTILLAFALAGLVAAVTCLWLSRWVARRLIGNENWP
jgi:hypothetical protein